MQEPLARRSRSIARACTRISCHECSVACVCFHTFSFCPSPSSYRIKPFRLLSLEASAAGPYPSRATAPHMLWYADNKSPKIRHQVLISIYITPISLSKRGQMLSHLHTTHRTSRNMRSTFSAWHCHANVGCWVVLVGVFGGLLARPRFGSPAVSSVILVTTNLYDEIESKWSCALLMPCRCPCRRPCTFSC